MHLTFEDITKLPVGTQFIRTAIPFAGRIYTLEDVHPSKQAIKMKFEVDYKGRKKDVIRIWDASDVDRKKLLTYNKTQGRWSGSQPQVQNISRAHRAPQVMFEALQIGMLLEVPHNPNTWMVAEIEHTNRNSTLQSTVTLEIVNSPDPYAKRQRLRMSEIEFNMHHHFIEKQPVTMKFAYDDLKINVHRPKVCTHVWKKEQFFTARVYETCAVCGAKKEEL